MRVTPVTDVSYTSIGMSVYARTMPKMLRTNVVIDEDLVRKVMDIYGLQSKREAVDFALRRAAGGDDPWSGMRELRGIGWEADLNELRGGVDPT